MHFTNSPRDIRYLLGAFALLQILLVLYLKTDWAPRTDVVRGPYDIPTQGAVEVAEAEEQSLSSPSTSLDLEEEKLGYVTWLGKTGNGSDIKDVYFAATRILVYQILHAPATRSPRKLPIIVMATPDVSEINKQRLRDDGATVVSIDFVNEGQDWLKPRKPTWAKIMSKLRAWELTEYSRLLMLDGDMILRRPLDPIFDEVNATLHDTLTLPSNSTELKPDELAAPSKYLFAGTAEVRGPHHHYPPSQDIDFIHPTSANLGFVMLAPSREMFNHYISILKIPNRFPSATMEQSLLNYAHRAAGAMPWLHLPTTYCIRSPTEEDIIGDVGSLHDKWWKAPASYPKLGKWYTGIKNEMEAFYETRDKEKELV